MECASQCRALRLREACGVRRGSRKADRLGLFRSRPGVSGSRQRQWKRHKCALGGFGGGGGGSQLKQTWTGRGKRAARRRWGEELRETHGRCQRVRARAGRGGRRGALAATASLRREDGAGGRWGRRRQQRGNAKLRRGRGVEESPEMPSPALLGALGRGPCAPPRRPSSAQVDGRRRREAASLTAAAADGQPGQPCSRCSPASAARAACPPAQCPRCAGRPTCARRVVLPRRVRVPVCVNATLARRGPWTMDRRDSIAAEPTAPCLSIPSRALSAIEHPCLVKNIDKGIVSLGGPVRLSKVRGVLLPQPRCTASRRACS